MIERPDVVKDEHLTYLDRLRESGITNMYGARPFLMKAFKTLTQSNASKVLTYWMQSFEERHP